jgi:hypothetical protein
MLNYRQFDAGPDPFGRTFHVFFKYQQNAISIRHADTVDVKFILEEEGGPSAEKVIAVKHPDLVRLANDTGRKLDDAWTSRLAAMHLQYLISTGEDMEKDLVTVPYPDLQRYAAEIARAEKAQVGAR